MADFVRASETGAVDDIAAGLYAAESRRIQELEAHLLQASAGSKSWRAFAVMAASALYPWAEGYLEKHLSPVDLEDLTRRFRKNMEETAALRARAESAERELAKLRANDGAQYTG